MIRRMRYRGFTGRFLAVAMFLTQAAALTSAAAPGEDYSQWGYARDLTLDAGDLAQNLTGYPLLVRFGSEAPEFFAKAGQTGSDLRFSLPDGTHLSYQIESWDPAKAVGAVWVRLPVVKAGQSNRIRVHCGKAGAADSSDGTSVFRTAEGFQGVWHMQPDLGDATANRIQAMDSGTAPEAGRMGAGRRFTNPESYATSGAYLSLGNPPALNFAGAITMQAWVRWGRRDNHRIILCHGSAPHSAFEIVLRIGESKDYRAGIWTGAAHYAAIAASAADSNAWIHLVGVYTGTGWILYRNGAQAAAWPDSIGAKLSPGAWRIGAEYAGRVTRFFHGVIDEVRIGNTARGADWVRLEYATQREDQSAVKWDAVAGLTPRAGTEPSRKGNPLAPFPSPVFLEPGGEWPSDLAGRRMRR